MCSPVPPPGGNHPVEEVSESGTGHASHSHHEEENLAALEDEVNSESPPVNVDPENRRKAQHDLAVEEQTARVAKKPRIDPVPS